jgi:hypothetical protein
VNDRDGEGGFEGRAVQTAGAPAQSFGRFLMEALTDKAIPAEKLKLILDARAATLQAEAKEAFDLAFAAFSAELPQVERDGMVELIRQGESKGRYPFTTIEAMDIVIRPLLAKHGLSISFASRDDKDSVTITGTLSGHGWERTSTYTLPPDVGPGRNPLQARGSSRRYANRYITDELCNVVRKGKDDDGRATVFDPIDASQIKELQDLLKATNTVEKTFLEIMVSGAGSLEEVRQRDFPRLVIALKQKKGRTRK